MNKLVLSLLLATATLLAACGHSNIPTQSTAAATYQYKNQTITLASAPQRIIPLSGSLLGMLYAVDGSAIARPTTTGEIPDGAKSLPQIGHVSSINAETLVSLKPDLVIGLESQNQKLISILEANHLPYALIDYDGIDDNVSLLRFMGEISGHSARAKEVISNYEQQMTNIEKKAHEMPPMRVAILRATGKSVTAETPLAITASMTEKLGMKNVITEHLNDKTDAKTVPYSLETLANDNPDLIFVVTMGKADQIEARMAQEMTGNPAWSSLQAVQNGRVFYLPSDLYLLNPGIRTPEAMQGLLDRAYFS